jgi:hypothetical protein
MRLSSLEKLLNKHAKDDSRACRRFELFFVGKNPTLEILKKLFEKIQKEAKEPFKLDPSINEHYVPFVADLGKLLRSGGYTATFVDVMAFIEQWEKDAIEAIQQNQISLPAPVRA